MGPPKSSRPRAADHHESAVRAHEDAIEDQEIERDITLYSDAKLLADVYPEGLGRLKASLKSLARMVPSAVSPTADEVDVAAFTRSAAAHRELAGALSPTRQSDAHPDEADACLTGAGRCDACGIASGVFTIIYMAHPTRRWCRTCWKYANSGRSVDEDEELSTGEGT